MIYTNSYDKLIERLHHNPNKYSALEQMGALNFEAKLTGDDLNLERSKVSHVPKEKKQAGKTNDYALKLANESQPIHGTLAEKYLKQHSAIASLTSPDLRFHPNVYSREQSRHLLTSENHLNKSIEWSSFYLKILK
ncbi:MAG: hypothetical protein A3F46_05410 [Legionellales bacterium RIFCSPHIGHO2_12_FULL_42_9]|nr:MAG: hypothetical protein A3F46_05410 [Legionellales bacterium RIFCSPHIGHO2_12_FULL_42_9]